MLHGFLLQSVIFHRQHIIGKLPCAYGSLPAANMAAACAAAEIFFLLKVIC
jgi:hypothetical protein